MFYFVMPSSFFQPKSPSQILAALDDEQKQDIDEIIRGLEEEHQYVIFFFIVLHMMCEMCDVFGQRKQFLILFVSCFRENRRDLKRG